MVGTVGVHWIETDGICASVVLREAIVTTCDRQPDGRTDGNERLLLPPSGWLQKMENLSIYDCRR